jgi:DNA-binding transcriptional LysR family regulator
MESYQLGYFVAVAEEGGFTAGAVRLRLAQSALSQAIRNLEESLGTTLFERGRKGVTLTPGGAAFLPLARDILARMRQAGAAAREAGSAGSGLLCVATIPSFSASVLSRAVAGFRAAHPGVRLTLLEDSSLTVAEMVERGVAEIGFVQAPAGGSRVEFRPVCEERFVVVSGLNLGGGRPPRWTHEGLAAQDFILFKGNVKARVLEWCRANGFEPNVVCETGELETLHALVAAGMGVAVVPEMAVLGGNRSLRVASLPGPALARRLGCLVLRARPPGRLATAFLECVERVVGETTQKRGLVRTPSQR